jgi:hypothetical protein
MVCYMFINILISKHPFFSLSCDYLFTFIKRYSTLYYNRLIGHENSYVTELRNLLNVKRRLKRQWPSDLKDQREEEE